MDFSTKPPRARQFDEKIVDALHRLNGLFLTHPSLDHAIQTERNTICSLLADAAFEGRRCRRAMDELVQNALQEQVAIENAKAEQRAAAAQSAPPHSAKIILFPAANAVRQSAPPSTPHIVA